MALKISANDLSRLQRGWRCITDTKEYLKMCRDHTLEEEGLSIFSFKRPSSDPGETNCNYYYTTKGTSLWDKYVDSAPRDVMYRYKSGKSFLVCVSVPTECGEDDEDLHKIGVFDNEKMEELTD